MIHIGDVVERTDNGRASFPKGERGTVIKIRDCGRNIDVELDSGCISTGNAPDRLSVIRRASPCGNKPTVITRINNYMKKFLDEKTRTLVQAGFINGDLIPTSAGIEALQSILFQENIEELVKLAQEKIEEAEEKK